MHCRPLYILYTFIDFHHHHVGRNKLVRNLCVPGVCWSENSMSGLWKFIIYCVQHESNSFREMLRAGYELLRARSTSVDTALKSWIYLRILFQRPPNQEMNPEIGTFCPGMLKGISGHIWYQHGAILYRYDRYMANLLRKLNLGPLGSWNERNERKMNFRFWAWNWPKFDWNI